MKSNTKSNSKKFVELNDGPCAILISGLNTPYLKPLSCYIPDCLLPVANVPVLHYTLSQLISEGFKRIVIYAIHGSSLIRKFVKFQYPDCGFIEVQCGKSSSNLGDVMRDLDANESIRNLNEYVLMPADLHCSTCIIDLFNKFKKIRSENNSFVLSVAFAPASTVKSLKCNKISKLWYRKSDMKIVHFNKFGNSDYSTKDDVQSCSNLEDVCLWFCTKHIAPLFQDLIQGILINEDIINYMIHCTILNADRLHFQMVCDLPRLLVSTNLVLKRETSINHYIAPRYMESESSFRLQPGSCNVYISPQSKIDRTVRLLGQCMISDGCEINANTVLINCTLGKNCIIGKNCKIRSLIALSGVEIMNNVVMDEAFICSDARILDGVKFQKKVFIGPSVVRTDNFAELEDPLVGYEKATCNICIGPNVTIPTRSVLMCPDRNVDILSEDVIGANGLATDFDKYCKVYVSVSLSYY